jgi:predicted ATPase
MHRYILTGGPGAGKTTVLQLLEHAGYTCVQEVARTIIRERKEKGLSPRPTDVEFALEILARDIHEYQRVENLDGPVFFDRGILDALCMVYDCGAMDMAGTREMSIKYSYSSPVFLLPPWKSIFVNDAERDQSFEDAVQISERLASWYQNLGYRVEKVPSGLPQERVAFILSAAGLSNSDKLSG